MTWVTPHIPPTSPISDPTSGLDSFQAQSVMETLRKLARAGRTVVASVHQPRSSIYAMLDRVMLLSGARSCCVSAQFFRAIR